MESLEVTVLGEALKVRTTADATRINAAKDFVEEQYAQLENRGGQRSRNALLSLLVLGIADEMLESHRELEELSKKITALLNHIDTNV